MPQIQFVNNNMYSKQDYFPGLRSEIQIVNINNKQEDLPGLMPQSLLTNNMHSKQDYFPGLMPQIQFVNSDNKQDYFPGLMPQFVNMYSKQDYFSGLNL